LRFGVKAVKKAIGFYCCEAGCFGGSCDGVPHAPNDRAKTVNNKAKMRRINTSPGFMVNEPTVVRSKKLIHGNLRGQQDLCWPPLTVMATT
jgi:hypothetical protein